MTTFWFLSQLCRLLGFARAADFFWARHEAKVKQQAVADAPSTRAELEQTLEDGNL